MHHMAKDTH